LEQNALRGLHDSTRFNGCRSLFDFLHRFLSNTDLYDYALLSRVPGFVEFKGRIEALHAAGHEADSEAALQELGLIFPVPNAPVGLDPAHCFEAERMRAMLSTLVKQHERAIEILQAAINRFEDVADDGALPMVCETLFELGQTEAFVRRPAAALATYRRLVQCYRLSTDPGVVQHVLHALAAEADIHIQNQSWQLAMTAFDEALTSYGHLSDPLGTCFIANTLFNRAGVLLELDRQVEAQAILLEIDRIYSKVADPDITAIVARALFQRGRLARWAGDVREEVECYSTIVSRFSTHDSLEVQEEVTAALFAKGAVLMRLHENGTARNTFCEVVEQGATVETERADELVTAAEIWAVLLECELGGRFAPDELATLVSQYADDERQRVRTAVAAGQQMLTDDRAR
jgi:tetratricopeptide (TPR) repeat protein